MYYIHSQLRIAFFGGLTELYVARVTCFVKGEEGASSCMNFQIVEEKASEAAFPAYADYHSKFNGSSV